VALTASFLVSPKYGGLEIEKEDKATSSPLPHHLSPRRLHETDGLIAIVTRDSGHPISTS
jgi:hypothetical protein